MMFGINLIYVFKGVAIKLKNKIINCRNKKVPINPATKYEVEKLQKQKVKHESPTRPPLKNDIPPNHDLSSIKEVD